MKNNGSHTFYVLLFLLACSNSFAQTTVFNMSDTTVSICKGQLFDSGGENNIYSNNEDLTFSICTGSPITLTFSGNFCVEANLDLLRFFDGPDTNAAQIGPSYSGITSPGTIIAPSGCLTIHFKSDQSVAYCGWQASWSSAIVPPIPPDFQITTPSCNDTVLLLTLTSGYRCDFVLPGSFEVTGSVNPVVETATALSCTNNLTTSIRLGLSQALSENCNYDVKFKMFIYDNCDSLWTFTKNANTFMSTCPFSVDVKITGNDTICEGTCTQIEAIPSALCFSYNYTWSHGLPATAGPHNVCPLTTTIYTVTVQENGGGSGASVIATQTITVSVPAITPLASDTICQSDLQFNFTASPPGGVWSGIGIQDTRNGTFHPDSAGPGTFYIKYTINNICSDSIKIVIKELDAGYDDAACIGGPDFQVSGGLPAGGTWSGPPFINSSGLFTPTNVGTYTITYSHPNGCSEYKNVFVDNLQITSTVDTICQSVWFSLLQSKVSPPGGRFTGNGVIHGYRGIFVPSSVNPGLRTITYTLGNGCSGEFDIYVKEIKVPSTASSCPTQGQKMLPTVTPVGGTWSGPGIINSNGLYDPAASGTADHRDTLFYNAPNGCPDTLIMYSYKTNIKKDSLFFCLSNDSLRLIRSKVDHFPENGVWSGPGISFTSSYYFNPAKAGPGIHTITYSINTCSDTIKMVVYPDKLSNDTISVCSTYPVFLIDSLVPRAAKYSGIGITDTKTGVFDPAVSGIGNFKILYDNTAGCRDTITIIVYQFQNALISGISSEYCSNNINVPISIVPEGGTLSGRGITGSIFNPANAGLGQFYIKYTFADGYCYTADSVFITNYPAIATSVSVSEDSICNNGGSLITVTTTGGKPNMPYVYSWSNGGFPANSQVVFPTSTTSYYITTSDGCSTPITDTVGIVVNQPFTTTLNTSVISCYGDSGYAEAVITPTDNYTYSWSSDPIQKEARLKGIAGKNYLLHIANQNTGCTFDTLVKIPSYNFIESLFSPNPNLSCVPYENNIISFIDLSNGADTGYWNFAGTILPYSPGKFSQFKFENSGIHNVTLVVRNEGNCIDSSSIDICIKESGELFIPDVFSPDGDGENDIFFVRGKGIAELRFTVYNRWGEKVFETNDPLTGWDGTLNGKPAAPAVYIYYVDALMKLGNRINQKGDITLIR